MNLRNGHLRLKTYLARIRFYIINDLSTKSEKFFKVL